MNPIASVLVIAKQPLPGRVKTRLIGEFTPEEAAELAGAALLDTLSALTDLPCDNRVLLLDGDPSGWVPPGWAVLAQADGGLDARLAAGFDAVPEAPAVLVGMDTPQLTSDQLSFDPSRYDACLGMAPDGGFWAIGFADPRRARAVILGVAMSMPQTGADQRRRLADAGMRVQLLPTLTDVDTPETARTVALSSPHTRFARQWRQFAQVRL
jgi:glycosyltransferase A (GT-A) superfamily protein (DUF2064 family)